MTKPKIILVMHEVPLNSPFLAVKFTKLLPQSNVHLLVWDKSINITRFAEQYKIDRRHIHKGITSLVAAINSLLSLFTCFLLNGKVRNYLMSLGEDTFASRVKLILYYLPLFNLRPDIIHFEFGTLAKDIATLKKLTNAKTIVSFRGYDINYVGLDKDNYYEPVWGNADAVHFLGKDIKARAIKRGYKQNRLEALIPPAIDTEYISPVHVNKEEDELIIISVGRLVWKKGYEYAIRAMAQLEKANILFEYRIVGEGPHLQALQFTVHELGLANKVVFLGKRNHDEIKDELNKAHVFLHPAISEGFCNAVIEAQAMELPVICSDADGLTENVLDTITGFVVPKWDVNAMADKLKWCSGNMTEMQKMGKAGREHVRKHFQIDLQIQSFMNFYHEVLNAKSSC
jgi:colanic acid/amylovoran biosynthesis glycosyltransferase